MSQKLLESSHCASSICNIQLHITKNSRGKASLGLILICGQSRSNNFRTAKVITSSQYIDNSQDSLSHAHPRLRFTKPEAPGSTLQGTLLVILGARLMFKVLFSPWLQEKQTNFITKNYSLHTVKSLIHKKFPVFYTVGLCDAFI